MKLNRIIIAFMLCVLLAAAGSYAAPVLCPAPEGAPRSDVYQVTINGKPLDLYGAATRYGNIASFGYFEWHEPVEVEIYAPFGPQHSTSFTFLPQRLNLPGLSSNQKRVTFTIDRPMQLTVIVTGDYTGNVLHLFANKPERVTPDRADKNVLYYGPGFHRLAADQDHIIRLQDNQTLYLAPGAVVEASVVAEDAKNIAVRGRGILLQKPGMTRRGIDFRRCQNVRIDGIILSRQTTEWSGVLVQSKDITVTDYKVISPPIWSSDGLNIVNCQNVHYDGCYFRTGDDCIAIKGLGTKSRRRLSDNPAEAAPNENILIENCIFWSDNNNAVVVGQESVCAANRNITFRDCDVLFCRNRKDHCAAMSVICVNSTAYSDITFENITVGEGGQLICVFFPDLIFGRMQGNHTWPGSMKNLAFKNITAAGYGSHTIRIAGHDPDRRVDGVLLENITINGQKLEQNAPQLHLNSHVKNVKIK